LHTDENKVTAVIYPKIIPNFLKTSTDVETVITLPGHDTFILPTLWTSRQPPHSLSRHHTPKDNIPKSHCSRNLNTGGNMLLTTFN